MTHPVIGLLAMILLGAGSTPASAQVAASSFEQLRLLVGPGDKISVLDTSGRESKGRIEQLSGTDLTLVTGEGRLRLAEADVDRVRQRRDDSLLNGAVIGAVAGAGYFVAAVAIVSRTESGDVIPGAVISGGLLFAGMGAGAGAGIDALIRRQRVIYSRVPGLANVSVVPLVDRHRRGAAVTVRF